MLFQNWLKTLAVDFARRSARRDRRKTRPAFGHIVLMQQDFACAPMVETLETRKLLSVNPILVADLVAGAGGSNPSQFVNVNGTLFFSANDGVSGSKLWQSDGTSAGTTLVKDIVSGGGPSFPVSLANVSGTLFFSANDGVNGFELWQSDGTSAGTTLVKDIVSGGSGSSPQSLTNVNGTLFFSANDGVNGYELWQSDGTSAGTTIVKDIATGGNSTPRSLTNVNGTLFFSATDGVNGYELWQSDGTSAGTTLVKDIISGGNFGNSFPRYLTNVNGTLFFSANDGVNGYELWQSDGTSAGTTLVKDIVSGGSFGNSFPRYLTNVNGTLFFRATDGLNGYELWQSDGTSAGTTIVNDIVSGGNSSPRYLTNVNGTLFFSANDGVNGDELWQSDGTSAGTTLVEDISSGSSNSSPRYLTNVNGTLFFRAFDNTNGTELWQADVPADTSSVQQPTVDLPKVDRPKVSMHTLSFRPPALVKDIASGIRGSDFPYPKSANVNGTLFFIATDWVNGDELWKSDGTSAGTTLVKDIRSGSGSSFGLSKVNFTNVNGTLFFCANDGVNGYELWKSDGTSAGTTLVKDIVSGGGSSSPGDLTNVNGTLFFYANDGVNVSKFWQSDGTSAGTRLVEDIVLSAGGRTNVNGTLFFQATDGVTGFELWKSDGTPAGTTLVKDIVSGSGSSSPSSLTNVNGTLFFRANNGVNGSELWKSDGTSAGTTLVKDIVSGSGNSSPFYLTNVNGTLFFQAYDGVNGGELWQSDGTSAGTILVKDIRSGSSGSSPRLMTNVNGTLFFIANDGVNVSKFWQSDGTSAGTILVKDIHSGSTISSSLFLTNVNGTLFFQANDGVTGFELWSMAVNSRPQLADFAAAVDTTLEDTEVELTFAEFLAQGDESDADGTVDSFIVQAVSSGSLKIGTSPGAATAFAVGSNDRIDATRNAYWTPAANASGNAIAVLTVLAQDNFGLTSILPVTAAVNVSTVADTPSVTNAATNEDVQSTSGLVISRNAADGPEVTHFKITNITGGLLFQNDGTTVISNNTFITFAQANAGLKFTPSLNSNATGQFTVQASTSNVNGGLGGSTVTAIITVTAAADTPSVTNAATNEDVQSTSGLVISRNVADSAEVTHFRITNITGGLLFQNDGTTVISNNTFITFAQANAGLKFTPSRNSTTTGQFTVQASTSNVNSGLGGSTVTASITVTAVADTPSVTNAATNEDVQSTSGLVISRNAADGAEVTHFKITNITGGLLFQNDGITVISNNAFITFAQANAGLKFTPSLNSTTTGHFTVQASTSNVNSGLGGSTVTASITVTAVADTPSVTNAATNEDVQSTSGLVISRNAADGAEVTHFKITNITGGLLFQNDGTTVISNNAFITFAQANAGLKFTPSLNSTTTGQFTVQASTSNVNSGLGGSTVTASIAINPLADTPSVTNAATNEDARSTSGLVISRNSADGVEVTHFKITNITGGLLFQNDGITVISNNAFITFAQANAGLKFTPSLNSTTTGHFTVQASTSNVNGGLGGSTVTSSITVTAVADTPSVTNAATNEDARSTSGLVISRNSADGVEVTHFKITNITGGLLFQNDGITVISNNAFITFAQANAGLKFTPSLNSTTTGQFTVQASTSNVNGGLGGSTVTASIAINPVADTPSVTNAVTNEDVQSTSGLVISRNAADGAEVTHFRITNITGGLLFQNDGITVISNDTFITFAQVNAGLKFTPSLNSTTTGHFTVQASTSNVNSGLGGSTVTSSIAINPVADTPSVTNTSTLANTQTTSGLVISRNATDGAEVTHFKITSIMGGTLFLNNSTTPISNGAFIAAAQAIAGLRFTPSQNSLVTGHFSVRASKSNSDAGLGGGTIVANISITPAPIGTAGNDVFVLTYSGAAPTGTVGVTISTNGGAARAFGTFPMNAALTVNGLGGTDSVRIVGTASADTITVNSSTGLMVNGAGLTLNSIETRTLAGAAGSDIYKFDSDVPIGLFTLDEAGGGTDTIDLSLTTTVAVSLNLSSAVSQLVHANLSLILGSGSVFENAIGGSGNDTLSGNSVANVLTGNAGNDRLTGGSGSDSLNGGRGDDTYVFAAAAAAEADQVTENTNEGLDTLNFAALTIDVVLNLGSISIQTMHTNRTLKLNSVGTLENAIGGSGSDTLLGNSLANRLTGGDGNNVMAGMDGADILEAGSGRDILIGGLGLDSLNGGVGDDILFAGRTTSDTSLTNLNAFRIQWISVNTYAVRIANLRAGVGSSAVSLKAKNNVLNDAGEDDALAGGTGTDWYFRALDDVVSGLVSGEIIDVL